MCYQQKTGLLREWIAIESTCYNDIIKSFGSFSRVISLLMVIIIFHMFVCVCVCA